MTSPRKIAAMNKSSTTNDESDVSHLRELYDERFEHLRRELEMKDTALELQAKEYDRRLDGLNHEAQRILTSQQKSISVEKFDGVISNLFAKSDAYQKSTDDKITELSKRVYIITGGLIIIEIVARFFLKL